MLLMHLFLEDNGKSQVKMLVSYVSRLLLVPEWLLTLVSSCYGLDK